MHLRDLESTQVARVALGITLMDLSCSPTFPRALITQYKHAMHEPILKEYMALLDCVHNLPDTVPCVGRRLN